MYLQSGWANWNLLVSFLHQHKPFTKLTHTTTFPATQISENSGKISDVFQNFLEVQAISNTQSFQHQPEHSTVQTTSLWTRTPGDQDYMTTTHNSSRSAADNAGFLLPSRRTSQERIFMFSFKPLLPQNNSPKLFSFEISFCVSTTRQVLVCWTHSPVWALVSRGSYPPLTIFSLTP